jgi:hypothetical protein
MTEVLSLPVSTSLLAEINAVGDPKRSKAQDGTIGDRSHMERASDHNLDEIGNTGSSHDSDDIPEVHARDTDSRGPWLIEGGAERIVQLIVANVRRLGHAKRRVKYVIYRRRIWVWRQADGVWQFVQQAYTGSDPHDLHFHVSFEYGSGAGPNNPENNTAPWGILAAYEEESMPTAQEIAAAVWAYEFTRPDGPTKTGATKTSAGAYQAYSDVQANAAAAKVITTLTPMLAAAKVDTKALAGELVPLLTASVLSALPQEAGDPVSADELQSAIVGALRELAAPQR